MYLFFYANDSLTQNIISEKNKYILIFFLFFSGQTRFNIQTWPIESEHSFEWIFIQWLSNHWFHYSLQNSVPPAHESGFWALLPVSVVNNLMEDASASSLDICSKYIMMLIFLQDHTCRYKQTLLYFVSHSNSRIINHFRVVSLEWNMIGTESCSKQSY